MAYYLLGPYMWNDIDKENERPLGETIMNYVLMIIRM